MKKLVLLMLCVLAAAALQAQADAVRPQGDDMSAAVAADKVLTVVQDDPQFPGGQEAMIDFVSKNIVYPAEARDKGVTGTVVVTFVVERNGSVSNVKVLRDIGAGCGKEAVRVVKAMPRWQPGRQEGKPVRTQLTLPLNFSF